MESVLTNKLCWMACVHQGGGGGGGGGIGAAEDRRLVVCSTSECYIETVLLCLLGACYVH